MHRLTKIAFIASLGAFLASPAHADPAAGLRQITTSPPAGDKEDTLLEGEIVSGGYGGPRVAYGRVAGHDAVYVGGEGGWIVNHSFILGGAGCGLVTSQPAPGVYAATDDLTMGYGGALIGYTIFPGRLVHATITALIGGGGLGTRWARSGGSGGDLSDSFFVFEPTVNGELNLARHLRVGVALSYRLVRGVETAGITNSDLSGLFGSMVIKFGKF